MSKTKPSANDRSMSATHGSTEEGEVFFFPKHNPPVSIRAASREEAERELEAASPKEV